MPRSVPLSTHPIGATHLDGIVDVYDPAMCCSTGVCGPGIDPALLQFARDLRWLEARHVTVTRHGLAQEPEAFASNPRVVELMATLGDAALPVTLVNGDVLVRGRYPTRDELASALTRSDRSATDAPSPAAACCVPGDGSC